MRAQKLDYVLSKNSYILLIEVINLKLRLITLYTFFETPGIQKRSVHTIYMKTGTKLEDSA